jgi:hypothetical protein
LLWKILILRYFSGSQSYLPETNLKADLTVASADYPVSNPEGSVCRIAGALREMRISAKAETAARPAITVPILIAARVRRLESAIIHGEKAVGLCGIRILRSGRANRSECYRCGKRHCGNFHFLGLHLLQLLTPAVER